MARRIRALLDANVILDVLQRREPFFDDAAGVVAAAERSEIQGLVAAHTVTTLFFLMAKHCSPDTARVQIGELLRILQVAGIDQAVIEHALALPYPDFEDCVQMAAAEQAHADFLVTRDRGLYALGPLPALTPAELTALLGSA
ncbi:MAG: PIN domain-containing protein [Thermoleophilia bacterium]